MAAYRAPCPICGNDAVIWEDRGPFLYCYCDGHRKGGYWLLSATYQMLTHDAVDERRRLRRRRAASRALAYALPGTIRRPLHPYDLE